MPLPPAAPAPQEQTTGWPANMASHGVVFTQSGVARTSEATAAPVATVPDPGITQIVAYVDPQCPPCGTFVGTNGDYLFGLVDAGTATLEVHPIPILDDANQGGSSRAVAAIAAVVSAHPDLAAAYIVEVFAQQPPEPESYAADQLAQIASDVGVDDEATIQAILTEEFAPFVDAARDWVTEQPLASTDVMLTQTPSVFVNGQQYDGPPASSGAFQDFVEANA